MRNLVIRTLDHLVLIELSNALEAKGVSARKRNRLLVIMVVGLETYATLENLIHLLV